MTGEEGRLASRRRRSVRRDRSSAGVVISASMASMLRGGWSSSLVCSLCSLCRSDGTLSNARSPMLY